MEVDGSKPRTKVQRAQLTREQARAEYEKKTKSLLFTKDFQTRQEVLMRDPLATVGERVMAWILRWSWGEYSLFAIRSDQEPAYQRDICKALGLEKTRVSKVIAYYQRRGYLADHPKLLYPVISPLLASPDPNDKKLHAYATFLEGWKVANASDFQRWEDARAVDKYFRKVVHAEYRKSQKQRQKGEASLLETPDRNSETGSRAAVSPLEASNRRHQQAPAQTPVEGGMQTKAQARALLFAEIARMQKAHPNTPFSKPPIDPNDAGDVGLVDRVLRELGSYDEQYLIGYLVDVAAKFKGWGMAGTKRTPRPPGSDTGPHSLGLLVHWAKDYARIDKATGREASGHA